MDGIGDDDDADVDRPLGRPVHPDDRLWRHPSEVASAGLPSSAHPMVAPEGAGRRRPAALGRWLPVVLAGTVGALLAAGVLTVTGGFDGTEPQPVAPTSSTLAIAISSPPAPADLADLAERVEPSLLAVSGVAPDGQVSRGSAVAVGTDHVLTAARLVAGARELHVLLRSTGRRATLVGADADTDLALLAVEGGGLVPAAWGEATGLRPGDPTVAVSSPPAAEPGPTVISGVISGIARTLAHAGAELRGLLQVDRPVPPEGAGGALLDPGGALVGITLPTTVAGAPFGYAVPAEVAKEVVRQLLASGRVAHPWLGVEGADRGLNDGAVVQRVKPGSPAARSGILAGDVVTEINGVPVPSMGALLLQLRLRQPGDTIRLLILRGGASMAVLATLSERP